MSDWERFGDWIATLAIASFTWVSSLIAPDVTTGSPVVDRATAPVEHQLSSIMRWAQQEEEPPIEQVGEDTEEDVETLDEAAPLEGAADSAEDVETLDQGPPAGAQEEDVELLDQGPPPATVAEAPVPATVTSVPITTESVPAAATGPVVPEGFGTGNVHVATGSSGFPVGLEDCHVGAVTGRAFVGIDCSDGGGTSFVGHAPSFDEFPFVLDESFPFGQDNVFADRGTSPIAEEVQALISAAHGAPLADEGDAPEIRTSGASTVEFEQRARDRKPRVEAAKGRAKRGNEARRGGNAETTASEAQDEDDQTSVKSKEKKKKRDKDGKRGSSRRDAEKKSKDSKQKKQKEKKGD